jgi:hypothetical protein
MASVLRPPAADRGCSKIDGREPASAGPPGAEPAPTLRMPFASEPPVPMSTAVIASHVAAERTDRKPRVLARNRAPS